MYILLVLLSLSTPLIILIVGLIFYKFPPKDINSICGYRTANSMKNIDTWREANNYSTALMIKYSSAVIIVTVVGLAIVGKSYAGISVIAVLSCIITVVLLIVMIVQTEKHLKNTFKL